MNTSREVAIWEVGKAEAWRVEGLNGYRLSVQVATARDAKRLVDLEDERAAILGKTITTVLAWHPRTGIGRTAVNEVTGEWAE